MTKTLVLIRHAHRDVPSDRTKDNGLSERGQEQIKKLLKFYKSRFELLPALLLSSPKKRCIETVSGIAKELQTKLGVDAHLDEQGTQETAALMSARIEEFLDHWKYEGPDLTVVCSHGDWIPCAIEKLVGLQIGLKKCGWVEIEYSKGSPPRLTWLVQKLY